jgi:ectoine hydroxylase-related dioxygenase (phytanoyl-CoA dioxygenase family)
VRVQPGLRNTGCVRATQIEEFDRQGIVKLDGAFTAMAAARMRDVLWNELDRRYGIVRDDASTWDRHAPTGLRSTKRHAVFAAILSEAVVDALDTVLGPGAWQSPKQFGNVLVTMPDTTEWRVPHAVWHPDFPPTLPHDHVAVVKLWALLDDVEPGGAGTPQLAGSNVLYSRYVQASGERDYKRGKLGFLKSHPSLRALTKDDGDPGRNTRWMDEGVEIDGVVVRVIECTGRAGDVYVTHPWVFHSIAGNASSRPRLMRSAAIWRRAGS